MTVALAIKVWDGIVLAADSSTTIEFPDGTNQIYNHESKVFHLHRERPVGAMTWGLGALGSASISSLIKEFRRDLMGDDSDDTSRSVEAIATRLAQFIQPLYREAVKGVPRFDGDDLGLGLAVAGYSSDSSLGPQLFELAFSDARNPPAPQAALLNEAGWVAYADGIAIDRLLRGLDPHLREYILAGEFEPRKGEMTLDKAISLTEPPIVAPAMPLQDAINLTRFLAEVSVGFSRYTMGPDAVGGQVDIGAISRFEGFKWIQRKHYYPGHLNPTMDGINHDT